MISEICQAENLDQLLSAAREHDNQYRATKYQYQASLARVDQAKAAFFPIFSLNANSNLNSQDIEYVGYDAPERSQQFDTYGYSLQLNQPIFRFQNLVLFDQAEAQVAQAQAQMEQAELDLVTRLAQAFYEALQAKAAVSTAKDDYELAQTQSKEAGIKYQHESAALNEKLEADSRIQMTIAQELEASAELDNKLFTLHQITGLNLSAENFSDEGIALPYDLKPLSFWLQLAETQSPNVLFQEAMRKVAAHEIDKAKSGHYPTMDLVASYGTSKQGPSASLSTATMVNSATIGLQVAVPIYSGGAVNAKIDETALLLQKADEELEAARKQAKIQVFQAYKGIVSNQAQLQAYIQASYAYQQSFKASTQGYLAGTKTPSEVFKSRQQLSIAQRDGIRAKTNILLNYIKLRAAIGDLNFGTKLRN
ncbi:MAG: TolC family protein [Methylomonas sp.]|nr:TolC family protein [Methylomonas sp.]